MKIAIDLDSTINSSRDSIDILSALSRLLCPVHTVLVLTDREPNSEQDIAVELDLLGIDYNQIIITNNKAQFVKNNNIAFFLENEIY